MSKDKPTQIASDVVVSLEYTLTVEGEVVDEAGKDAPLVYLHGYQNIVPGLEAKLAGMKVGDKKSVTVQPEDAYGEYDEEAIQFVKKLDIPGKIPLDVGVMLSVRDEDDDITNAWITEILADEIKLDFNHPLAGDTLQFDVKVAELRPPTKEELEHGHVHDEGHHH